MVAQNQLCSFYAYVICGCVLTQLDSSTTSLSQNSGEDKEETSCTMSYSNILYVSSVILCYFYL